MKNVTPQQEKKLTRLAETYVRCFCRMAQIIDEMEKVEPRLVDAVYPDNGWTLQMELIQTPFKDTKTVIMYIDDVLNPKPKDK